jgi:hypothetical protein
MVFIGQTFTEVGHLMAVSKVKLDVPVMDFIMMTLIWLTSSPRGFVGPAQNFLLEMTLMSITKNRAADRLCFHATIDFAGKSRPPLHQERTTIS